MFRTVLLFVFLLRTLHSNGQHSAVAATASLPDQFSFEHFSQENGLSQGTVYDIASYDGYMWFGTQDGLNRFDGHNFKTYRASRGKTYSLSNSWVQALLADRKGRFWVGTVGGLCLYNAGNERFQRFAEAFGNKHLLDSVSVEKLDEDKHGNVWVMTDERGLFRVDSRTGRTHSYLKENNRLYDFCTAPDGKLWVSTYD
ncbi:hypothetical protein DYBT9275_05436 [Dyadobacter sp. CECT 9275]|uniref:Hybrid sensor histidine kinase/response regulator n=1 Tax=Dyadobacter helix TaxID=2822344 RepID=A0A916JIG6_9BACT|nr:two-component regulator propeller domain-containing protein [Dyadobacter sp. CECT 9275]CAG5015890.1 hypothetical protein DYBT9275_05436 [Dyadobacter sp. CECT 9275]